MYPGEKNYDCERINNKQNNSKRFHNCIIDVNRFCAGLCFKNGEVKLGKSVLYRLNDRKYLTQETGDEKK